MDTIKKLFSQQLKNIYHLVRALIANVWYGFPSKKLRIIGITGTNGKTTTTQMVTRILEEAGKKVAMTSTINFKLREKEWVNATKYTTMSSFSVQKFIRQAVDAGCEYLVLETSSHSLNQHRVWGVAYDMAVITNVTREHLDYHKTMDKYRKAKKMLFEMVAKNTKVTGHRSSVIIVNLDMGKPEEFLDFDVDQKFGYSTKTLGLPITDDRLQKIVAENIEHGIDHSKFKIKNSKFFLHLPGLFNIENALAATCVGLAEGIDMEMIANALVKIMNVPGRFELVPNDRELSIIVDYAVTPDSLEKLYELVDSLPNRKDGKVIAVFGSCGNRDRGKRPIMGEIVSQHADYVIIANEDPYTEDPQRIIDEVAAGVKNKKEGENFWKIMDRRLAISKALHLATAGDVVVVTGKGAEETMAIGNERIPWNEKKIIVEELAKL